MQIGFGNKQPGPISWSGVGESWICWSYCSPRKVAALLITLPPSLIQASELEILGYDEKQDDFFNVEIDIQRCRSPDLAESQDTCVLILIKVSHHKFMYLT